jgi:hypothetical protein
MVVTWKDGRLEIAPEDDAERDAMLLLWSNVSCRLNRGEIVATDFGAKFDGISDDTQPIVATCKASLLT